MNFRAAPDMFLAKPKRQLAVYTDLTMPRRDWSKFDPPAIERSRKPRVRAVAMPALLQRQAS